MIIEDAPNGSRRRSKSRKRRTTRATGARFGIRRSLVRDLTDEVITVTTARAEELFDDLVDTLGLGTSPA